MLHESLVQKAYDILANALASKDETKCSVAVEEALGYLGEYLEG